MAFLSIDPGTFSIQVKREASPRLPIGPITVAGPTGSSPVNPPGILPVAPVVLSEQLVIAGKGKNRYVAGIVLTFSSALDPATARNSSNYSVMQTTAAIGEGRETDSPARGLQAG